MYMSDWNSLTNDEKRERLENLEVAPVAAAPVAEEEKKEIENPEEVDDVPLAAAAAPAVSQKSFSLGDRRGTPRSKTPPPEEVERSRREWELKKQREKLEAKRRREKRKERERERERQRNAAEPGKSTGYIDSQLRRRYYIHHRVIVLFTGDDPPKWYKGTILNVNIDTHPPSQRYYVVFDDGDERWIEYKNNNIRYFGVKKKKKVEGLVPGQRVRNNVTKSKGIILEGANRSNMIKVKVMRPDNSHFIQYWSKSVTAISPWRGGGTQRKTKRRTKKRRKKKKRKTRRKTTHRRKHRTKRRRKTRRR